jgi:hypothetical protein
MIKFDSASAVLACITAKVIEAFASAMNLFSSGEVIASDKHEWSGDKMILSRVECPKVTRRYLILASRGCLALYT